MNAPALHTDTLQTAHTDVASLDSTQLALLRADTASLDSVQLASRDSLIATCDSAALDSMGLLHPKAKAKAAKAEAPAKPVVVEPTGNMAMERPYNQASDDYVSGIILICLLLLFYVFGRSHRYLKRQASMFFKRPLTDTNQFKAETGSEHRMVWFLTAQKCLVGGLLAFFFLCKGADDWYLVTPQIILGIYVACFAGYYLLKYFLSRFANWIFFDKVKKLNWKDSYSFLSSAESLLFLPVALVAVYDNPPMLYTAYTCAFILLLLKLLLLYRTYNIFFGKMHCVLHLIVYFCTLELLPLTVLFASLVLLTNVLIVK